MEVKLIHLSLLCILREYNLHCTVHLSVEKNNAYSIHYSLFTLLQMSQEKNAVLLITE